MLEILPESVKKDSREEGGMLEYVECESDGTCGTPREDVVRVSRMGDEVILGPPDVLRKKAARRAATWYGGGVLAASSELEVPYEFHPGKAEGSG